MIHNRNEPLTRRSRVRPAAGAVLAAVLLAAALGGCAGSSNAGGNSTADASQRTPGSGSVSATEGAPISPEAGNPLATDQYTTELLQLHDRLKSELGPAYSDAWVDGGVLHVALTDPALEPSVRTAGAVPVRVAYNADDLRTARAQVQAWLASEPLPALTVHGLSTSGRTGEVTVLVPADQAAALQDAAAEAAPAGDIPVIVKESRGMATPLPTK